MKTIFRKNRIFLVFLSFFIIAGLVYFGFSKLNLSTQPARAGVYDSAAGTGHNLSGFAWSSNIGWISFNSTDCDNDGTHYSGTPAGCPSAGTLFFDYGVYINPTSGDISGFAWSENVGWISFNRDTSYCAGGINIGKACAVATDCPVSSCGGAASGATGNPLYSPYNSTTGAIAKYNTVTHTIDGWAKILSMGDDGWISFNCSNNGDTCGTSDYKVSADVANSELDGWAWNGDDSNGTGIGWISFNSDNSVSGGGNYAVKAFLNQKPTIDNLSAPNWTGNNGDACDETLHAKLTWQYKDTSGNDGTAYAIAVSASDLADPTTAIFYTGKCGSGDDCIINIGVGANLSCLKDSGYCHYDLDQNVWAGFDYNKNYYWWVRVWDDVGEPSDWVQYNVNSGSDTDENSDNNPKTFTTYKHEFPQPYFTWTPAQPAIGEDTLFISRYLSKYATDSHTDANLACTEPPCVYNWTDNCDAGYCDIVPASSPDASSTVITFTGEIVGKIITLTVTDSDGYYCSTSTTFNIKQKMPTWIEAR